MFEKCMLHVKQFGLRQLLEMETNKGELLLKFFYFFIFYVWLSLI